MDPLTILGLVALGGYFGKDLLKGYWARSTEREKLTAQEKTQGAKTEAMERLLRESRTEKRRSETKLTKELASRRREERESILMKDFMSGQNRNLMLAIQAIQGLNQPMSNQVGSGMMSVLRSNL